MNINDMVRIDRLIQYLRLAIRLRPWGSPSPRVPVPYMMKTYQGFWAALIGELIVAFGLSEGDIRGGLGLAYQPLRSLSSLFDLPGHYKLP
jgi:hypothetical protein